MVSEVIVEAEHKVVGVQIQAPVLGCAVILGRCIASLVSEEAYVSHKAEFVVEVKCHTGTETYPEFYSEGSVSSAHAQIYATVDKQIYTVVFEEIVTDVWVELEYSLFLVSGFAV